MTNGRGWALRSSLPQRLGRSCHAAPPVLSADRRGTPRRGRREALLSARPRPPPPLRERARASPSALLWPPVCSQLPSGVVAHSRVQTRAHSGAHVQVH